MSTLLKNHPVIRIPVTHGVANERDISGYEIFSQGSTGATHVLAHRMLDTGRIRSGRSALGKWLTGRTGHGGNWVHLHFHMAIFELEVGEWRKAYTRFLAEILPAATTSNDALTDAPALLWRLAMSAPEPVVLPWQPLRQTALACMHRTNDPFVELHNLLALAGVGDATSIEHWLQTGKESPKTKQDQLVKKMALALMALASRSYSQASSMLQSILPDLSQVGGSHAQNRIYEQLRAWSIRQSLGEPLNLARMNAA